MKQKSAHFAAIFAAAMMIGEIGNAQATATLARPAPVLSTAPATTAAPAPGAAAAGAMPIAPIASPGSARKSKAKAKANPSKFAKMAEEPAGQCSGDLATEITKKLPDMNVDAVRKDLQALGKHLTIGTCQPGGQYSGAGVLGYNEQAKRNLLKASASVVAITSGTFTSPEQCRATWDKALSDLGVGATAVKLEKCGILNCQI